MANAILETNIAQLHEDIASAIKAQFPALKLVAFYHEEQDRTPPDMGTQLPACLLELVEMELDEKEDPQTDQLALWARFEARLMIGFNTPQAKIQIRQLAAVFATWIHKTPRFHGESPSGAHLIGIHRDDFSPLIDKYEIWCVEWREVLWLGETVWTDEGQTPANPVFGFAPDIGQGNEDKYEPAT